MKYILVAWLAGCSADGVSTQYALNRGAREIILTQSNVTNGAIIGSEMTFGALGLVKLSKTHPKLAVSIAVIAGSFKIGIASHNIHVVSRN